ncbi:DUF6629 family protein [Pontibacter ruber]|uniref:DUF6629 family protein n=1 Tax=Pontibacter ruber TaxID=1343895 RepID=A0ABW5D280_9BACT|nr:DUF6629 family protein [Pontibacter ruber]
MCFSAEASFGASAALCTIGVLAVRETQTREQTLLAGIPFLFSAQQFTEGIVWLGERHTSFASLQQPATYLFLVIALLVWPTWIVFSVFMLEKEVWRKRLLAALLLLGVLVASILGYGLFSFPVKAEVLHQHIHYRLEFKQLLVGRSSILYFIPTVVPPFVSSVRLMWLLGLALLVVYVIAKVYYTANIVSVWCFFAAIISAVVLLVLRKQHAADLR